MYEWGYGVLQNYPQALKWYNLSAEQGNVDSQINLGIIYANGFADVRKDYAKALKWYRLSAEQGNALGQSILAGLYVKGFGVLKDNVTAYMWYNIASANGDEIAGKYRDEVADQMTTSGIEKATAMARECMKSDYKKCGY
jgi:uncharacterized protein